MKTAIMGGCILALLLTACIPSASETTATPQATLPAFPTQTAHPPTATFTESATEQPATPSAPAAATATLTPTISPISPGTLTAVAIDAPKRSTPVTLMLHESTPDFDAASFLESLIPLLKDLGFRSTTYQEMAAHPEMSALEQGQLCILTIDDVYLQSPIDESIQAMIRLLENAGYRAVLGVVTSGKLPDPGTSAELKRLAGLGWEIAAHTENHRNLHEMEFSPGDLRLEIRTCADKIEQVTGVRPITLILPGGQMVDNARPFYKEGILWAVGINGGEWFDPTDRVIYVGREGAAGTAEFTLRAMFLRFGSALDDVNGQ